LARVVERARVNAEHVNLENDVLQSGQLLGGRYRLIRSIGEGGMACVWAARHELLGRDVALKLSPTISDPCRSKRFIREAAIIGRFEHQHIVTVVDAGELPDEGYMFLAMELLHGTPLSTSLDTQETFPVADALEILIGACRGLEVLHEAGVVHRDVKPENIFLAREEGVVVPKIVDFGISLDHGSCPKITFEGEILGTPAYMSPEQALGKSEVTARADVWSIGVVLFELLAGRQPFVATNHHALLRSIVDDPTPEPPASLDPDLRAVLTRCLEKSPDDRYASAADLRADLEAILERMRASSGDGPGAATARSRPLFSDRTLATGSAPSPLAHLTTAASAPEPARHLGRVLSRGRGLWRGAPRPLRVRIAVLAAVGCSLVAIGTIRASDGASLVARRVGPTVVARAQGAAGAPREAAMVTASPAPACVPAASSSTPPTTHHRPHELRDHRRSRPFTRVTTPGF
jgi:eukaryotic-like serine/threonine-protein kinase